ncbi:CocE/NonD family hydrolase [Aureimonas sp. AU20]|uniref:CocE/NonD family hydrolase n=1 Tax=Aureimonas sp. AU20 TaxID=1349819 RepID=UPI00071EBB4E|nr:CocE/NonD family hydrolase [Aureimonas sp. AU20]ALN74668.1 hypothetical protein M673_18270 [Aureimonas sp. AU20]
MAVQTIEHLWIPLIDGTRLGARLWLPEGAEAAPVPAILEYIPYRKRDGTRGRDEPMHGYFAEHGYAALRVDMRGTGESDGLMEDEYLLQEQDDALEVIAWIAEQPWCSGAVGMMGKSWGGFNGLQVAARRPPALKAIITAYSTDDRFRDDIHYMGGCLLNDNLWWGAIMLAYQSRPLDPEIVGPSWRESWLKRLDHLPFFPALWMRHQRYDEYWKHGSVQEDWSAIECPVLAIGGWADSYTNAVPRLLEKLRVPRLGIIGPWGHIYPQDGVPGPAIGFLQEAVRWWDHWLKGQDRGIMREPMLRAWLSDSYPPDGTRGETPGRWVGEPALPSPQIRPLALGLAPDGSLRLDGTSIAGERSIRSPQSHGRAGGEWMGTGCVGEMPVDQRLDDGGALLFETAPLEAALPVLGAPVLHLRLKADAPQAQIAVRLSEVLPGGEAVRVSYQVLNLAHRDGHEAPEALTPGEWVDVRIKLNDCGHRFAASNRIRLAVATAYWPLVWPAPYAATLTVDTGASRLELPRRERDDDVSPTFPPPERGSATPTTQLDPGSVRRWSTQDHVTGETLYVTEGVGGLFGEGVLRFDEIGTELSHALRRELTIRDDDPLSARYVLTQSYEMGREGWRTRTETRCELTSDRETFHLTGQHVAFENGQEVHRRDWDERIARDHL